MKSKRVLKRKSVLLSKNRKNIIGETNTLSKHSVHWKACGDVSLENYIKDPATVIVFASGKVSSESAAYVAIRRAHILRQGELQKAIHDSANDAYTKAALELSDEDQEADARREEELKEAGVDVHA